MDTVLKYNWVQCKSGYYLPSDRTSIYGIILHSTDGRKNGDIQVLSGKTDRRVSVHWYTTITGDIYHFVQDKDIAFHCGTVSDWRYSNTYTVGIEQEHIDGQEAWPDALVKSTALVVAYLRHKFGNTVPVKSHAEIAFPPGRKVDPVDYPWNLLSTYVKEFANTNIVLKVV